MFFFQGLLCSILTVLCKMIFVSVFFHHQTRLLIAWRSLCQVLPLYFFFAQTYGFHKPLVWRRLLEHISVELVFVRALNLKNSLLYLLLLFFLLQYHSLNFETFINFIVNNSFKKLRNNNTKRYSCYFSNLWSVFHISKNISIINCHVRLNIKFYFNYYFGLKINHKFNFIYKDCVCIKRN